MAGKKNGGRTKRTAREVVLAGKTVTLDDGRRLKVRPWGIELREELLPILAELVTDIVTAGPEVASMTIPTFLMHFTAQVDELVQITIGYDDAQMKTLSLADIFRLTNSVMSVCVITEDGGGPLGEFLRLYVVGNEMLRTVLSPTKDEKATASTSSTRPSERSSRAATRLTKSGDTPPN